LDGNLGIDYLDVKLNGNLCGGCDERPPPRFGAERTIVVTGEFLDARYLCIKVVCNGGAQ